MTRDEFTAAVRRARSQRDAIPAARRVELERRFDEATQAAEFHSNYVRSDR